MKKIINDPELVVDHMLEGLLHAHADQWKSLRPDNRALARIDAPVQGKVAIATGGGSGHLPLFLGYVGPGLLDGVAIGDIFASPSAQQMLDVTRGIHGGAGVLYIYGNYGGDVMNFDMAAELADLENIKVESVVVTDDVASMPKGQEAQRRGVAGMFFVYKVAAAKAELGASLEEVKRVADKANANIRTMGIALTPCILPALGRPSFEIGDGVMEIGMGIHGEPGIRRDAIASAAEVAETLVSTILDDLAIPSGSHVAVLVNGLGATPLEELYIIYREVHRLLADRNIRIVQRFIGEYATSMEMAGLSVSIMLLDDELGELMDMPFQTPLLSYGGKVGG